MPAAELPGGALSAGEWGGKDREKKQESERRQRVEQRGMREHSRKGHSVREEKCHSRSKKVAEKL